MRSLKRVKFFNLSVRAAAGMDKAFESGTIWFCFQSPNGRTKTWGVSAGVSVR